MFMRRSVLSSIWLSSLLRRHGGHDDHHDDDHNVTIVDHGSVS